MKRKDAITHMRGMVNCIENIEFRALPLGNTKEHELKSLTQDEIDSLATGIMWAYHILESDEYEKKALEDVVDLFTFRLLDKNGMLGDEASND